ncbi:hypothetical protein [Erythrobacter alti]|uniref:hypothetical protein n=1 Tax=Erythrobacter alti TaxID=1896145 RepID=UPI0030F45361
MTGKVRAGMLLATCGALSACGSGGGEPEPPPVTSNEQQAIAEAAEMLDERLPEVEADSAETPAPDGNE